MIGRDVPRMRGRERKRAVRVDPESGPQNKFTIVNYSCEIRICNVCSITIKYICESVIEYKVSLLDTSVTGLNTIHSSMYH